MKNLKDYSMTIAIISVYAGGIFGFINWLNNLSDALYYGETFSFVIQLVFFQILIPINGLIPGVCWFIFLFIVGLPFYGIYKLFKND